MLRLEDAPLLRGRARYVGDLRGGLHAVFVRSTVGAGRVRSVDVDAARSMPGVVLVARAGEHGLPLDAPIPGMVPGVRRPLLASDVVRHVGEPLAVVVAETEAAARDAAELVVVVVDATPAVVHPDAALAAGAPIVHEGREDNVYLLGCFPAGDAEARREVLERGDRAFASATRVVELATRSPRVAASPMEPNGVVAIPDEPAGGVTLYASSQFVHGVRREVAHALGLDEALVRVVTPQVGGGFGPKFETAPEYVAVAALARTLGRVVRWQELRSENLVTMPHGRGHHQLASIALDADARITAIRARVRTDAGAYPIAGAGSPVGTGVLMVPGPYDVREVDVEVRTVATNTPPVGVYRGPGRAEPNHLHERLVDVAAAALGIDPIELRRRNLVHAGAMPYRSATGFLYDSGDYAAVLDEAVRAARVDELRAEQAARRARGDAVALGIGVSCWIDVTPRNRAGEWASVDVHLDDDGALRVLVRAGTCDHGQGHATAWALVLSEALGVPFDAVALVPSDTAQVPRGDGTGSARSLQLVASTLGVAADEVLAQARPIAAALLEADARDIVVGDGGLHVAGSPARTIGWAALAREAAGRGVALGAAADVDQDGPTFPFGVHVAVVEVDTETGRVSLRSLHAVDDCGRVVNPVVVEGQQHGGIAQGVAQALYEHAAFAEDGTPLASTFLDYLVPSAADLPSFDVRTTGAPTPRNRIGAKGIGQGGAIGAPTAVVNAVCDALAPFGVRHLEMPLSPEQVWQALAAAGR